MNMSFIATIQQIRDGTKTVTRRGGSFSKGWQNIKAGQIINAVEKTQGLGKGGKIVPIRPLVVVSERWERLDLMLTDKPYGATEVVLEGFPELTPDEFVEFYCRMNKCEKTHLIHRIEFTLPSQKELNNGNR